nr:PEPxxWA-CTERM sorting domain-containing protein [Polymorphobacter sp.]
MIRSLRLTLQVAVSALAMTTAVPAFAVPVTGDPVLYWNEVMLGTGYNPGQVRPAAMVNVALHDAVNATLGNPDRAYLGSVVNAGGDTRAAASVAARDVLVTLYPARTAEFDAALVASLALVPDGVAKTNGMATGAAMAAATIARRANDGTFNVVPYTPSGLPGRWAPTPPGFVPSPVTPQQGLVTPWVVGSGSQFRPGAPPALTSDQYAQAFNEVKAIGSATSLTRTADQTASAQFWAAATGPGPWIRAAIDVATASATSTLENARVLGLLSTTVADAVIATWDAKYTFDYWRPVTGIRNADLDGNAGTVMDAGWTPLIVTPPHPSFVSAHSAISAAASAILADAYGVGGNFCVAAGGTSRCWANFDAAALDAANSRLWGGIHWSFDNQAGLQLGQEVAAYALAGTAFDAVPEPATWAMLIAGFGLVGAMMRKRRQALGMNGMTAA